MELAGQLAENGFAVDLYMLNNSNNHLPFFENQEIRILPFPQSKFQQVEFWTKIMYSNDRKYKAIIATPLRGTWVAYKTARLQKIPFYYFADELVEHLMNDIQVSEKEKWTTRNYLSNKKAIATIALGEERYQLQKKYNKIDYPHDHIVIPNAPSGDAKKLRSHYFRDIFDLDDRKPILLFAGTLNWNLANKIFEETKNYGERDYHLIFQSRTLGLMGNEKHSFIKMSTLPIPTSMLNYAFSSADIGLALYDKNSLHETNNGFTGGKIGSYLKNQLPLIIGSADNLKLFEREKVGTYWDGETAFDDVAHKTIQNMKNFGRNIPAFYKKNLQYEVFFQRLKDHLINSIKR
jgi:hypothetical protein